MNQKEFEWLHQAQMEIMDEIHRICVKEGINYYLIGGSAIGAVRHKGFIPWDFDIDCGMLRQDYDRFKDACSRLLNPRFKYYDYKTVKGYTNPHALVAINGTKLYRKYDKYNHERFNPGIYLDVFSLDAAPDTEAERDQHEKRLQEIRKQIYIKRHYSYRPSLLIKAVKLLRSLRYIGVSIDELNDKLENEKKFYQGKDVHYVCIMSGKYAYEREAFPLEWFGTPILAEFEGRHYYIPQETDKMLRKEYGDYMQLPPESERKANLEFFENVVFDKEYK